MRDYRPFGFGLIGLMWVGSLWAGDLCQALSAVAETAARAGQAGVPLAALEANIDRVDVPPGIRAALRANTLGGYAHSDDPDAARAASLRRCLDARAQVEADITNWMEHRRSP